LVVLFFGYGYGVAMTTHLDPPDHAPQPPMILTPQGWHDYRLLDSGHGQKLEEVGGFRLFALNHRLSGRLICLHRIGPNQLEFLLVGQGIRTKAANGSYRHLCLRNGQLVLKIFAFLLCPPRFGTLVSFLNNRGIGNGARI